MGKDVEKTQSKDGTHVIGYKKGLMVDFIRVIRHLCVTTRYPLSERWTQSFLYVLFRGRVRIVGGAGGNGPVIELG